MSHTAGASNRKAGRRRQSIPTYVSSFPFELAKSAWQARGGSKASGDQPASQPASLVSRLIHPPHHAEHSAGCIIQCTVSGATVLPAIAILTAARLRCGIILTRRTGPLTQPFIFDVRPPKTRIEFKSKLQINKSWSRSPARSARPAIPPRM